MKRGVSGSLVRRTEHLVPATLQNVFSRVTRRARGPEAGAEDELEHRRRAAILIHDMARRLGKPCDLLGLHATRTGSLTVRVQAGDRFLVAKLPLHATTEPRLRRNAQALKALGKRSWVTPFLSARWPALVLVGTASDGFYSVESRIPGQDGASIMKEHGSTEELVLSAEHFLLKLQKASLATSDKGRALWEAPFAAAAERVEQLANGAGEPQTYQRLIACIKARLAAQPLPSVLTHGNFWLGNVLFDTGNALAGVIDWDCMAEHALPAIDLMYLLVRTHSLMRGISFGEAFADWIDAESLPFLDECAARHCHELSIGAELVTALSYCCWIQHLDAHCRFGTSKVSDRRWLDRNVRHVLRRWRRRPRAEELEGRWLRLV